MNYKHLFLMPLLLSLGALSSCNPPAKDGEKKVALSFSRHFGVDSLAEGYDDPNVLFHGFDEKVERNGVSKMEKRYIASEMEVQAMLDKKANFIIASVPDFTCLCWKNFVKETFSTVIVDLKADVYVIDAKTAIKNEAWGIQTSGNDPVLAIMSNGKAAYQTALKEKSDLVTNKKKLSLWIENRATFSQMYWVNEESEVQSLRNKGGALFYYGRTSCSDCTYFETNFLFDYLAEKGKKLQSPLYYIDCDSEGRRFKNGELDQEQWNAYKASHNLAESEDNPAGYGTGYVPTLMKMSAYKEGEEPKVELMDVYFNDSVKKIENGHYVVEKSFFSSARNDASYLRYLGKSDYTVLEGLDLGECSEEGMEAYYWYRDKLATYHNRYATYFLDFNSVEYSFPV